MSALGHKQTFAPQKAMSASPPKADICRRKLPIVKHDHRLPDVERRALWDYWSPQAGLAASWRSRQGCTSRTATLASAENLLRLPSGQRFSTVFQTQRCYNPLPYRRRYRNYLRLSKS
jgi:hypothetical protein